MKEIRRTATENGGKPLGIKTFERQTGIRYADWFGKHWKSWGDALREAGFEPNILQPRIGDDELLRRYVGFTRELRRVPVKGDLRLKHHTDRSFPNDKVFNRFGPKSQLVLRAREYCLRHGGFDDVVALFNFVEAPDRAESPPSASDADAIALVYLIKSGPYYKIGRTNSVGRRERELAIQLPEKVRTVPYNQNR